MFRKQVSLRLETTDLREQISDFAKPRPLYKHYTVKYGIIY